MLALSLITGGKASAATPPDSCFNFNSGTGTIEDYFDYEDNDSLNPVCTRDVDIPATISSTPVTTIGFDAFRNSQITGVTIPSSVVNIESSAFRDNYISLVSIPDSVNNIATGAFKNNQITSLNLGSSVTTISNDAFDENELTTLVIPDSVISIGVSAFSGNRLTSLTLGNSVTTIGDFAFSFNQLTSVNIPNSLATISPNAFIANSELDAPTSMTLVGSGDPVQVQQAFDSIRLVNLFTLDPSNPNNLQDSVLTEAILFGADLNENGNQDDVLGGHLINPAEFENTGAVNNDESADKLASTGQSTALLTLVSVTATALGSTVLIYKFKS